jgi:putative ABC transport system permease protein
MRGGRVTTLHIALGNIWHRQFRSVCTVLLIAVTMLMITGGTLLGYGLRNGVDSINARLGADAMVVPLSAGDSFEGALLSGAPSTFYLTTDVAARITQLDGVARATEQLFISTFDSEHCAAFVQIIGYDPKTDFVVAPWLKDANIAEPGYGEAVVGGNLTGLTIGSALPLFSVEVTVAGLLDQTGMGFDNSVFVNMETAQMLLGEYETFTGALPLPEGAGTGDIVSAVLLDFQPDTDPLAFQRSINHDFRGYGLRYVSSQALLAGTSKNLALVIGILTVLLTALWVLSVFVLAVIFTLSLNERRREFGILRAIGATRRKLTAIVLTESALLCGAGSAFGVGLVCLVVFPYSAFIKQILQTAYLPPQSASMAALLVLCFVLGAATGPLASLFSAARIGKHDAFSNMQEGL